MRNNKLIIKSYLIKTIICSLLFFVYWNSHSIREYCYGDCGSYMITQRMVTTKGAHRITRFSKEHFSTILNYSSIRSLSIPFIYSLFNSKQSILLFHKLAYFISWLLLAFVVSQYFKTTILRNLSFFVIFFQCFAQGYHFFNTQLTSDSLSQSFIVLYITYIFYFCKLNWDHFNKLIIKILHPLIFLIICFLAAGGRPVNLFVLVFSLVPLSYYCIAKRRFFLLSVFSFILLGNVFLSLKYASNKSDHNFSNLMRFRFKNYPGIYEYFHSHGVSPEVGVFRSSENKSLYKVLYAKFLAFHPTILFSPFFEHKSISLEQVVIDPKPPEKIVIPSWHNDKKADKSAFPTGIEDPYQLYSPFALLHRWKNWDHFMPMVWPKNHIATVITDWNYYWTYFLAISEYFHIYVLLSLGFLGFIFCLYYRDQYINSLLLFWLLITAISLILIGYHGDQWEVNEVARHSLAGSHLLRLSLVLCIIFGLDYFMLGNRKLQKI